MRLKKIALLLLCFLPLLSVFAQEAALAANGTDKLLDLESDHFRKLFHELTEKHGFSDEELRRTFSGITVNRRVLELMDSPWEAKPYNLYRPLFVTDERIRLGREMLALHREIFDRVENQYGVDREIIAAIWGIETKYGQRQGGFSILRSLATIFDAYPRRRDFGRNQLINLLLLCRENVIEPASVLGSYAGAFGQTQFIPSSFRKFAVDFDADQRRDVWNSVPDILASIANYLGMHGWKKGTPLVADIGRELKDEQLVAAAAKGRKGKLSAQTIRQAQGIELPPSPDGGKLTVLALELPPEEGGGTRYLAAYPNFQAITEWNHSNRYAMAVVELAATLRNPAPPAALEKAAAP